MHVWAAVTGLVGLQLKQQQQEKQQDVKGTFRKLEGETGGRYKHISLYTSKDFSKIKKKVYKE